MAKIYYSIDTSSVGYPVHWLDELGREHVERINIERIGFDSADVDAEFKMLHPGAVWLKWDQFLKRRAWIETERDKMNAWNAWVMQ